MALLKSNVELMGCYLIEYINEFLLSKEQKSKSEDTRATYTNSLKQTFKDIFGYDSLEYITKDDLEILDIDVLIKYFNKLYLERNGEGKRNYSNSTINNRMTAIRQLLKYLTARKVIKWEVLDFDSLLKSLPDDADEIEAMPFEVAQQFFHYFRNIEKSKSYEKWMLARMAVDTALRAKELLDLKWTQFYVEKDYVLIKSDKENKGKGNKKFLDKISLELYYELLELKNGEKEKVFSISYRTVAKMMERANAHLKLDRNYTFHSFKKTAVSSVYFNTGSITEAMKKGRHKNLNTTRRYIEDRDYGVTGVISLGNRLDTELYKKVSHEQLLETIEKMNKDFLYLLNLKLLES